MLSACRVSWTRHDLVWLMHWARVDLKTWPQRLTVMPASRYVGTPHRELSANPLTRTCWVMDKYNRTWRPLNSLSLTLNYRLNVMRGILGMQWELRFRYTNMVLIQHKCIEKPPFPFLFNKIHYLHVKKSQQYKVRCQRTSHWWFMFVYYIITPPPFRSRGK